MKKLFILLTIAVSWDWMLSGAWSYAGPQDVDYFKQFLYRVEKFEEDPDNPIVQYRFLMNGMGEKIPLADGRTLLASVKVFMQENQKFLMIYDEAFLTRLPGGQEGFMPGQCKEIEGNWSVPDTQLVIEDLALGDRAIERSENKVKLTFSRDIVTAGLKGSSTVMSLGYSNVGIENSRCFKFGPTPSP